MHYLIWPLITPWHRSHFRMKKRKLRKLKLPKATQLGNDRTWKFSNLGIFALKATVDLLPHEASEASSCLVLSLLVWGYMWKCVKQECKGELKWRGVHTTERRRARESWGKRYWEGRFVPRKRLEKECDRKLDPGGLEMEFGIMMSTIIREMFDSSSLYPLGLVPRSYTLLLAVTGFSEQEKEAWNRRSKNKVAPALHRGSGSYKVLSVG